MSASEQRFMATTDAVDVVQRDLQPLLAQLHAWQDGLDQALDAAALTTSGLTDDSSMAAQALAIEAGVEAGKHAREEQWRALQPAQQLAGNFDDKVMLLVFGKFNAGKSSLCNFLAGRFREQGRSVQYFHLEGGQICYSDEGLHEGATETTARLQGVCLGQRLVLLDTPGLHSATDDNAALTQRFLDSADAVLWLTSSTSPGQVQELDELARELHRGKPLLPIVTRSDTIEEDEVDGAIVKLVRNKSSANRSVQEQDVQMRAADKLRVLAVDERQLKAPVSVSAHVARKEGQGEAALHAAGFERLYGALLEIVGPALVYKQRKPVEVLLHHFQEQVIGSLHTVTVPALADLFQLLQDESQSMAARRERLAQLAWRDVVPQLPALLEQHASLRDVKAVTDEVAELATEAFAHQVQAHLGSYVLAPMAGFCIELPAGVGYEADADNTDPVGYEKLYSALAHSLRELLADRAANAVAACEKTLQALEAMVMHKQEAIVSRERLLQEIGKVVRTGSRH